MAEVCHTLPLEGGISPKCDTITPDVPARFALPGSGCVSHYFPTEPAAEAYCVRQSDLARNRGDDLITMIFDNKALSSIARLGRFEVRCWYGPFRVWVTSQDYTGPGKAERRESNRYLVRKEYPRNEELLWLPVECCEHLDHEEIERRSQARRKQMEMERAA